MWQHPRSLSHMWLHGKGNVWMKIKFHFVAIKSLSPYRNLEGDLFLKNGALKGLSALSRSMDTKLEVADGAVKITAGMNVTNLEAPFETSTSVPVADSFNPDVSALVEKVGIVFGIVIPFSSGVSNDRKI